MKTILLATVLTTAPTLATEQCHQTVVHNVSSHVQKIVPNTSLNLDNAGMQTAIVLGSLFLGSALGALADAQYRKRVPPDKRIEARVLEMLRNAKKHI